MGSKKNFQKKTSAQKATGKNGGEGFLVDKLDIVPETETERRERILTLV